MTNKKSPNVTNVIGSVRITSIGLTMSLNNDNTIATQRDVIKPSTETPGNTFARMRTAIVVPIILKIDFVIFLYKANRIPKKMHCVGASFLVFIDNRLSFSHYL